MKKIVSILALAALLAAPMAAQQSYQHSVGVSLGNFEGLSYKGFVLPNPHLALQVDLGFKLLQTPATSVSRIYVEGNTTATKADGTTNFWTFELNPNLLYQNEIDSWDWGGISWYAGGGISGGIIPGSIENYDEKGDVLGKVGINAIGGVELGLDDAPLAISFDFRPGYGCGIYTNAQEEGGVRTRYTSTLHYFDWAIAIGLRYTL